MLTIGKVATQSGLSTNALRFYEREGLIYPAGKSPSGYRLYSDDALARVSFIQQAQHCGFTLSDIQQLLTLRTRDSACCNDVRGMAVEKKLQLEARIRAMKAMSQALDILIAECPADDRPLAECAILGAMDQIKDKAIL